MLSYITVGANDVPLSGRFYTAILTPLGYEKNDVAKGSNLPRKTCQAG
jgi:hypothetical protein